ncbi:Uncultured bacterium genome assembly Metasoil_fosmids_resub OS=uncultured bacterium PE=4 SV=1 [Gemmata massiliana]|uniref:Uncharacterized protein n=1 Tax=Gemmata massiliana TaxID=1210884 RepID=A0A6P2CWC0_9BACT|nr:hypothetical protein [Gemmata massiliana]VTR92455.1 Uncultured bacterium genome assembly Metasoil_fosmids_resub OS=uncultured bacterium PE=4 SV=1 [Gemmata massiliana]
MVTRNPTTAPDEPIPAGTVTADAPAEPLPPDPGTPLATRSRSPEAPDAPPEFTHPLVSGLDLRPVLQLQPFAPNRDSRSYQLGTPTDHQVLTRAVADALGFRPEPVSEPGERGATHLGSFTSADGTRYTCFLAFITTANELRALIPRLRTRWSGPLLLLCTAPPATITGPDHRPSGVTLIPLAAVAAADGLGHVRPVPPLEAALIGTVQALVPGPTRDRAPNALWHAGEAWLVTFAGKTVPFKDLIGLWYLSHLIQAKGKELRASELRDRVHGRTGPELYTGVEAVDRRAAAAEERACQELREEIDRPRRDHDPARVERLQEQLHVVTAHVQEARGLGGRVRRLGDESTSVHTSVKNAIDVALEKL